MASKPSSQPWKNGHNSRNGFLDDMKFLSFLCQKKEVVDSIDDDRLGKPVFTVYAEFPGVPNNLISVFPFFSGTFFKASYLSFQFDWIKTAQGRRAAWDRPRKRILAVKPFFKERRIFSMALSRIFWGWSIVFFIGFEYTLPKLFCFNRDDVGLLCLSVFLHQKITFDKWLR